MLRPLADRLGFGPVTTTSRAGPSRSSSPIGDRRRGQRAGGSRVGMGGWLWHLGWTCMSRARSEGGSMTARSNRSGSRCASNSRTPSSLMYDPPSHLGLPGSTGSGSRGRNCFTSCSPRKRGSGSSGSGHVHHESSHRVGAAEIATTPSTGLESSPTSLEAVFVAAPPGYRLVELDGTGTRRGSCACRSPILPQPD